VTSECINFRDVGESINKIAGEQIFQIKRIYRGGSTDYVSEASSIGCPHTIINLRNVEDRNRFGADYYHFPLSNEIDKYDASNVLVHTWLKEMMAMMCSAHLEYPIFFHCSAGKDRTGVVIAAMLKVLDIPDKWIIEEYMLSEGRMNSNLIIRTLGHLSTPKQYFSERKNLGALRERLMADR
jgi:protein-tyrosine phosphatase